MKSSESQGLYFAFPYLCRPDLVSSFDPPAMLRGFSVSALVGPTRLPVSAQIRPVRPVALTRVVDLWSS